MLILKKVAITGGVSSGKSSVSQILAELGAYCIDSDVIVHQLLSPDTPIGQQVIDLVGRDVLVDGKFDRGLIAEKVFAHSELLLSLEKILHPAVRDEINKQYERIKNLGKHELFVVEIPLLYEGATEGEYDAVVTVVAPEDLCRHRFRRKGKSDKDYTLRMARQLPQEIKAARADYMINNDGDIKNLKIQVKNLYRSLLTNGFR